MSVARTDLDLEALHLEPGPHDNPDDGGCVMEIVSALAGEPWSDRPQCVSPVITSFCISWNDALGDEERDRLLKPFLTKMIGTRTTPEDEETRAWMACDWLVRTFTPTWLRRAGLDAEAEALVALPELTSAKLVDAAMPVIERGAAARAAARAAAGDAARAAARDAAWAAAGDAARAAARDALADTVTELQSSAVELLDRMCAVGR